MIIFSHLSIIIIPQKFFNRKVATKEVQSVSDLLWMIDIDYNNADISPKVRKNRTNAVLFRAVRLCFQRSSLYYRSASGTSGARSMGIVFRDLFSLCSVLVFLRLFSLSERIFQNYGEHDRLRRKRWNITNKPPRNSAAAGYRVIRRQIYKMCFLLSLSIPLLWPL